eukprot:UN08038
MKQFSMCLFYVKSNHHHLFHPWSYFICDLSQAPTCNPPLKGRLYCGYVYLVCSSYYTLNCVKKCLFDFGKPPHTNPTTNSEITTELFSTPRLIH